jgi:hypothetical protein
MAAVVDWDALLTVAWSASAAAVGVSAAYGLAILGSTRAVELGRVGRAAGAAFYALVGALGVVSVVAAVALGILVVTGN